MHFGAEPAIEPRPIHREPLSVARAPAFRLRVPIAVTLDDIAAELNSCCLPVQFAVRDSDSIVLSNATIQEDAGQLLLGIDVSMVGQATTSGTLYIVATPFLDDDMLRLKEIDLTVASNSLLTPVVAEIGSSGHHHSATERTGGSAGSVLR